MAGNDPSLTRRTAHAVRWTALSTGVITAAQLLQLYIATQITSAEELGLFYIILLALGVLQIFADGGFTYAVIHKTEITANELSSIYWLTVIIGVGIYALLAVIGAPLLAAAYREPRLEGLMVLGSLAFIMLPFGIPYMTLLQKELRFELIAKIEMVASLASLGVLLAGAAAGYGLTALLWAIMALNLVKTIVPMTVGSQGWRPQLHCNVRETSFFLRFGVHQIGVRLTDYAVARADRLLISAYLGPEVLGYYVLAWNIVVDPVHRINPILTRVLTPVLAKVQDDRALLKRGFLMLIEAVAMINMPLVAGVAAVASLLIPLVFGPQWLPSVAIAQVLALVAAARAIGNPTGALVLAKGRADMAFRWSAIVALCQAPVLWIAVRFGSVLMVAASLAVFQVFVLAGAYWTLYRPLLGPCLAEWLGVLVPPVCFSGLMLTVVLLTKQALRLEAPAEMAILVAIGGPTYLMLYYLFRRRTLSLWVRIGLGQ
jgi:O-antigen/teichoic acid export membrane protein